MWVQRSDCLFPRNDLVVLLDIVLRYFISRIIWVNKTTNKIETIKTICNSVNHTRFPKEYHQPDWARRDNKVAKGDRVEVVLIKSYQVLISRYEHAQHGIPKNIFTNLSWRYVRWLCWIIRALQSRMLHEESKSSGGGGGGWQVLHPEQLNAMICWQMCTASFGGSVEDYYKNAAPPSFPNKFLIIHYVLILLPFDATQPNSWKRCQINSS